MATQVNDAAKHGGNYIIWCLNFCCIRGDYFLRLGGKLESLKYETDCLTNLRNRIKTACTETPWIQQLNLDLTRWLKRVENRLQTASKRMKEAEDEVKNKRWRWFCPKHCCSFTALETELIEILEEIKVEIKEGHRLEDELAKMPSPLVALERPSVGLFSVVNQVLGYIRNPNVQIIGLYDMDGSAKPNLLKVINQKLFDDFDVVISVTVAKEATIAQLQDAIIRKIRVPDDLWENKSGGKRHSVIHKFLDTKKFVLLLDGLTEQWRLHDLLELGVPLENNNENKSKIIFTTSTVKVLEQMKVDVSVDIALLTPKDALKLSKDSVESLPPDMAKLAAVSEGPIAMGIPTICWVRPKRKFVETRKHLIEHSPY